MPLNCGTVSLDRGDGSSSPQSHKLPPEGESLGYFGLKHIYPVHKRMHAHIKTCIRPYLETYIVIYSYTHAPTRTSRTHRLRRYRYICRHDENQYECTHTHTYTCTRKRSTKSSANTLQRRTERLGTSAAVGHSSNLTHKSHSMLSCGSYSGPCLLLSLS